MVGEKAIPYLHFIVVRKQEFDIYYNVWGSSHIIIELVDYLIEYDKKIYSHEGGVGYARNFSYLVAKKLKLIKFWMIDDNIKQFYRISSENMEKALKCSFAEIIIEISKIFSPNSSTTIEKTSNFFIPYDNDYIINKKPKKIFNVFQDGIHSHENPSSLEENENILSSTLNLSSNKQKPSKYFSVGEFSGPPDRYAIIGLKQWENFYHGASNVSFSRVHCSCVFLVHLKAIEKINKQIRKSSNNDNNNNKSFISYPLFPIAEDLKFNDRCDYNGLWICRCSVFQFVKPQKRKKELNLWSKEFLLYFRLLYDTNEIIKPYIRIQDNKIKKTKEKEKALKIPLRKYGTIFNLLETLSNSPIKQSLKSNPILSIFINNVLLPIHKDENLLHFPVLQFIIENNIQQNEFNIYDLCIKCQTDLIDEIIPTDFLQIMDFSKKQNYDQYDILKFQIHGSSKANCEIIVKQKFDDNDNANENESNESTTIIDKFVLPGYKDEHKNCIYFSKCLSLHGNLNIEISANQESPFVQPIHLQFQILSNYDDENNIFSIHKLIFDKISCPTSLITYLKQQENEKLYKKFQKLIQFYNTHFPNYPAISNLDEIKHDANGVRLSQVLSYLAILRYYKTHEISEFHHDNETNGDEHEEVFAPPPPVYPHPEICLPTGMGKSLTSLMLPFQIAKRRVIIVTPTLAILEGYLQYFPLNEKSLLEKCGLLSHESFSKIEFLFWINNCGRPIPSYCSNRYDCNSSQKLINAHFIFITFQSLTSLAKIISNTCEIDLLIIDECHHIQAASFATIRNKLPNTKIIGLSATPNDTQKIADESLKIILKIPVKLGMVIGEIKNLQVCIIHPETLKIQSNIFPVSNSDDVTCLNCNASIMISDDNKKRQYFCNNCDASNYIRNYQDQLAKYGIKIPEKILYIVDRGGDERLVDKYFYKVLVHQKQIHSLDRYEVKDYAFQSNFRKFISVIENEDNPPGSLINIIKESVLEIDRIQKLEDFHFPPQAIVICATIQQINYIVNLYIRIIKHLYIRKQISCIFTVGSANEADNITKLKNGYLNIIIQCKKLSEGFDHKPLSVAVVLRPIRSLHVLYQVCSYYFFWLVLQQLQEY